jgi:hypothetical protein
MAASESQPAGNQPKSRPAAKLADSTVRISSVPSGALVLVCPGEEFREDAAEPLGKTSLLRLMSLTESNMSVRITKPGFQLWNGKLLPTASEIKADLIPLTDAQKHEQAWFASTPCHRLTVVPVRLGIKKVSSKGEELETSSNAAEFTNRFLTTFESKIKARFAQQATLLTQTNLASEAFWQQLSRQMKGVRISTIGFTPVPIKLNFPADINAQLDELDGAILFVRVEAHYVGKGAIFMRAAVPILLSAASAAGGMAAAQSAGSPVYVYNVYGGMDTSSDLILVQMFLVHSHTRELMWYGQVAMPAFYELEHVTEKTATKAAEQVPAAFLEKT